MKNRNANRVTWPSLFPLSYHPSHEENRMSDEGDVDRVRERFLSRRPSNLNFLLQSRYQWMNAYLHGAESVFELGAGAGFSKVFVQNPNLKLTDVSHKPWIDNYVDALNLPFPDASVDCLVCSHMIHHLAFPKHFFEQAKRVLKPNGIILISDLYLSTLLKTLLYFMRHEGWAENSPVFDERISANDPSDPWSANCAIPRLLFEDAAKFETQIPGLKIDRYELTEGMIFPLSGGVIARTWTMPLPVAVLRAIQWCDNILIRLFPEVFALGMRVVIRRSP